MTPERDPEDDPIMVAIGLVALLASALVVVYALTRLACFLAPTAHLF